MLLENHNWFEEFCFSFFCFFKPAGLQESEVAVPLPRVPAASPSALVRPLVQFRAVSLLPFEAVPPSVVRAGPPPQTHPYKKKKPLHMIRFHSHACRLQ